MTVKKQRKKELKMLISTSKTKIVPKYNRGGKEGKKRSKRIYRTSQSIRIISYFFLGSLLSESFPLLGVTVYFTFLVKLKVSQLFLTHCNPLDSI